MKQLAIFFAASLMLSCSQNEEKPAEGNWIKGSKQEQIEIKERHFGGFGTTMTEVGYRYQELFWAGQNENWEYAKYQLKEMESAMKKGFERRPNREANAKNFMESSIPELMKSIETKNKSEFNQNFEKFRMSCTACHAMEKLPEFVVETPKINTSIIGK